MDHAIAKSVNGASLALAARAVALEIQSEREKYFGIQREGDKNVPHLQVIST